MIALHYKQVDFEGVEEENNMAVISNRFYLGTLPKVHNKVYDMSDQPFTLQQGEIVIGSAWQALFYLRK